MSKQRAPLALAAIAALGLAAAGGAYAAFPTEVELTVKPLSEEKAQYKGRIKSDSPYCEKRRILKVTSQDRKLVKLKSDADGKFDKVGERAAPGRKLHLLVKAKGEDCEELRQSGTAH